MNKTDLTFIAKSIAMLLFMQAMFGQLIHGVSRMIPVLINYDWSQFGYDQFMALCAFAIFVIAWVVVGLLVSAVVFAALFETEKFKQIFN